MSTSENEDQQRTKVTMEDPKTMTVDFLRARLLAERSVSKSARQRVEELAKRVSELEEQLKFVSLQREKAEKATADVLAILDNHGISDVSEGFDSSSDIDETQSEIENRNGRSLSWRSGKNSNSLYEKKKYMDSARRSARFATNGSSSARRIGKSCRRIRRRETRALVEDTENDCHVEDTCSSGLSNCMDRGPDTSKEGFEHEKENNVLDTQQVVLGNERLQGDEMEKALQHQAQLIGQYEEEEKAQREWEEKFGENNSCTPESYDHGIHSDVTEEHDEISTSEHSLPFGKIHSNNQGTQVEQVNVFFSGELLSSQSFLDADKERLQQEKCRSSTGCELSASEFSFPLSKGKTGQEFSDRHHNATACSKSACISVSCTAWQPSAEMYSPDAVKSIQLYVSPENPLSGNTAVVPQESSIDLGSVLEELQQAKLSLKQKLNNLPAVAGEHSGGIHELANSEVRSLDKFDVPVFPGLFRLPTDQMESTVRFNHQTIGPKLSSGKLLLEAPVDNFLFSPLESRISFSTGHFLTVPPSPMTKISYGSPLNEPHYEPRFSAGSSSSTRLDHLDPQISMLFSPGKHFDHYSPDSTSRLPPSLLRMFPSIETREPM